MFTTEAIAEWGTGVAFELDTADVLTADDMVIFLRNRTIICCAPNVMQISLLHPSNPHMRTISLFNLIPSKIDGTGMRLSDSIRKSVEDYQNQLRSDPYTAQFVNDVFNGRRVTIIYYVID